jgi:hypothetical protein
VGRRIGTDRDVFLPYLVEGEGLAKLEAGQGVPFDDHDLAQGILAAYFERPSDPAAPKDLQPYLACALDELVAAFRRPSLEVLVLEISRAMGLRHGWALAREALRTGRALLPDSAQVACDYVVALWRMLEAGEGQRDGLLREILELAPAADAPGLRPMAREFLALVHLAAMAAAEEYTALPARLEEARRLVADPYLRGKLQELEAHAGRLDPRAFDLFETRAGSPGPAD